MLQILTRHKTWKKHLSFRKHWTNLAINQGLTSLQDFIFMLYKYISQTKRNHLLIDIEPLLIKASAGIHPGESSSVHLSVHPLAFSLTYPPRTSEPFWTGLY